MNRARGFVLPENDPSVYSHTRLINDALNTVVGIATEPSTELPVNFGLHQNYPNPFNPTTVITYQVPRLSAVSLRVYDTLGRQLQTLVSDFQEPGTYTVVFEAQDLPSGIYFYKLQVGNGLVATKKMLIMK